MLVPAQESDFMSLGSIDAPLGPYYGDYGFIHIAKLPLAGDRPFCQPT